MQSVLRAIYPSQCVSCGARTESDFGLCGPCWRETAFIGGLVCDTCGIPLAGQEQADAVHCDDCMLIARPWTQGRAVSVYKGSGRKIVLQLKHGDRTDLARPAGEWMAAVAAPLLRDDTVIVPVPLHWTRLLTRRYNQAAVLAHWVGAFVKRSVCPDAIVRLKRTRKLDDHGRDARFALMQGMIASHPRRMHRIKGRSVLIVDDVMTSGVSLAAATEAAHAAGETEVCVLHLARVAKDA
jgi:predicted amidophosphoribosyltransferase